MEPEVYIHGGTSARDSLEHLLKNLTFKEEIVIEKTEGSSLHIHYSGFGYTKKPRPYQDIGFLILYAAIVLVDVVVGIFAIINHNPNQVLVDSALYNSSSGLCSVSVGYHQDPLNDENFNRRSFSYLGGFTLSKLAVPSRLSAGGSQLLGGLQHTDDATSLLTVLVWILIGAVTFSVLCACALAFLLRAHAKVLVYACPPLCILILVGLNVLWFLACTVSSDCKELLSFFNRILLFILVLVVCGALVWTTYSRWYQMERTITVMQNAAQALVCNWGLCLALPGLSTLLLMYIVPFGVFMVYAYMNGEVLAMPGLYCVSEWATDCCQWKVARWFVPYWVHTTATILWSILIMKDAQVYIVNGAIAEWYFTKTRLYARTNSIKHAVRNALGPSFGTLCLSGLGLCVVRMVVRAPSDRLAKTDDRGKGCFSVVRGHGSFCYPFVVVEASSKLTINVSAVTGESYSEAAGLLKSSLSSCVPMEVISTRLLAGTAFIFSTVYAVMVFAFLTLAMDLGVAYYMSILAGFVVFLILIYVGNILDNVIDSIHVCHAIEDDKRVTAEPSIENVIQDSEACALL